MLKKILQIIIVFTLVCFHLPLYARDLGDVNGDTVIDIVDGLLVAQYYVDLSPDPFYPDAADVDNNRLIDIVDALLIARFYVGLIDVFPGQGDIQIIGSGLERNLAPETEAGELKSVTDGNNQFTFDLFHELKKDNENILFSPISITLATAMCYAGAEGNTETEMASTLHFTLPEDRLHNAFNELEITLTKVNPPAASTGEDPVFHIVNSTWGQKDYYIKPGFLDILALHYGASMNIVDFILNPDASRLLINDWVRDATEDRIQDLIPHGTITPDTRLVLTNAIYFKANWLDSFDAEDTTDGFFYQLDGSGITASMMYQYTRTNYCEVPGEYQAVELPYQGTNRNSMVIILPAQGQFNFFENNFTFEKYNEIINARRDHMVHLTIPKFSYEWDSKLKQSLIALGMEDAFDDMTADFSGITGAGDLRVDDVIHKTFISVDEKGTEASAATAYIMGPPSIPKEVTITIDRPFYFVIRNMFTGTIIFFGKVLML